MDALRTIIYDMIHYILTPILGGVIGYITNDIAIRMLFRPHTAKYLFGIRIPFTPGLIPKEKARIASSIGDAISENLMSKEVLQKYLLSEDMVTKLRSSVENFLNGQKEKLGQVKLLSAMESSIGMFQWDTLLMKTVKVACV